MKKSPFLVVSAGIVLLVSVAVGKKMLDRGEVRPESAGSEVRSSRNGSPRSERESTGPTEIIRLVDPRHDTVEGNWTMDGTTLVASSGPWARLQFPCMPPDEYDLDLEVIRTSGTESLNLGIVVNGRQCMVVIGGKGGTTSGMEMIDGKNFTQNETTARGQWLPLNQSVQVRLSVRSDMVVVSSNGAEIFKWTGDPQRLSLYTGWRVPHGSTLFVGCFDSSYRFERAMLTPISGRARFLR